MTGSIAEQDNLVAMFFNMAESKGDAPFLWAARDERFAPLSWRAVAAQVRALANGLIALGMRPGDRVLLASESRPEWAVADLGVMAAGGVTVPAYITNTEHDHQHVITDSGARFAIVSTARLAELVHAAAARSAAAPRLICMEDFAVAQTATGEPPIAWDAVLALGAGKSLPAAGAALTRDDLACLIYTSGTGGAPKGVMQTHGNILHNCEGARALLASYGLNDEVFLSFLPLSHSYEHTVGQFFPIAIGAQIYYAEGLDKLGRNMMQARPTIMTAVPRLYETLRDKILAGVTRAGGLSARLFTAAVTLGAKRYEQPLRMTFWERLADRLLDRLVRRKIAARFGGRLKAFVSGGGPLNHDVGLFFTALGVRLLQGYGQTESGPAASCNTPFKNKLHTVGPPLKDTAIRIAEDGEILIRGALVMKGYWNNADATRAAIDDHGWLRTGDIGVIDHDGYLQITDRKKDIIVNSGGDNIAPQRIEGLLTLEPEIAQAMVHGDRRPHLVALLVADADFAAAWAAERGKAPDMAALRDDPDFIAAIRRAVERVNARLSPIEKVRRFTLAAEPFSVDNEQMTPTMKVRRHRVREVYGEILNDLYGRSE